jgi:hypothetical protein
LGLQSLSVKRKKGERKRRLKEKERRERKRRLREKEKRVCSNPRMENSNSSNLRAQEIPSVSPLLSSPPLSSSLSLSLLLFFFSSQIQLKQTFASWLITKDKRKK